MNQKNSINIDIGQGLGLRSATDRDLDNLRSWKNSNRQFFFHQNEISAEQQLAWYESFALRPYDYMLMIQHQDIAKGCIGIRRVDDEWEIYNVILGDPAFGKQGNMGRALIGTLEMALKQYALPITLNVLKHNPAVAWYLKNGFVKILEAENYFGLRYEHSQHKGS
jgi:ribosomal protein S18 acetylase RimI-like enzyme